MAKSYWVVRLTTICRAVGALTASLVVAETPKISVVEGIAIKNGNRAEAIYYYENNWLSFRKEALELGYIDSYELIVSSNDSSDDAGIVLITHFESAAQFSEIEANFEKIMQHRQLQLLNDIEPGEFRENIFVVTGEGIRPSD